MKKLILPLMFSALVLVSCNKPNSGDEATIAPSDSEETTAESSTTEADHSAYYQDVVKTGIYTGSYYDSITSTDKDTLISQLNTLLNTGYQKYSYSTQTSKLKLTDSYDSNYVECLYTGERLDKDNSGSGAGQWNKEHIWAKTYGFGEESYQAFSDIQMLRVTECSINGKRSDKYFDNVESSNTSYGCSWNDLAFEPRDEVKGDVARIMFYMTVMYNSDTLNLVLTDDLDKINSSKGQKGGTQYLGKLSTLLQWAKDDPVDEREITRNNNVFAIQKNRNPFIDHPEYAYYIFKDECDALGITYDDLYDDNTYVSSNSDALNYMNSLVDSIGEVTLEKEELINSINEEYSKLASETKSFFKGYKTLQEATYKLAVLKDLASRDTTINTTIDLTVFSSTSGSTTKNGVSIDYTAALANQGKGLYAQTSTPLCLNVSNLYDTIKSCEITYYANKNNPSGTITIFDGTTTISEDISASSSKNTITIDISKFDLSKELKITVTNKTGNSIILTSVTFKI